MERCKHRNLYLKPTWPTHQRLWENQDTENVRKIEREILTWSVNPMLNEKEIEQFVYTVNEYKVNITKREHHGYL